MTNNIFELDSWTDKEWGIFFANLDLLRRRKGLLKGELSVLLEVTNAYRRKGQKKAGRQLVLSACQKFNVTEDWLGVEHTGESKAISEPEPEYALHGGYEPDPEKSSGFSADSSEWRAMGKLHDLLSGGNGVFKRAIIANLDAFSTAKDIQSKNEELAGQVKALRNENTTLAARLDTLEQQLAQKGLVVIESTADARIKTGPGR
jgi:hypothetical protein